ncbi:MAG: WecB/TagA/CpsF family glycosyltransferase [bacterium]|nr:WecB/TagA/CpsF family glycosyltransferase [bacterium]
MHNIVQLIDNGKGQIITANAEMIYRAHLDAELKQIFDQAQIVTPDGMGVVLAAKILKDPVVERISGYDLLLSLAGALAVEGKPIYLLGGAPTVAESAGARLKALFPGLKLVGARHGYFTDDESISIINNIRDAKPAILFVALGFPRQEKWIHQNIDVLPCVAMGVGGSFDVLGGKAQRAPLVLQKHGLEWAYRLYKEPWRFKRMMVLPKFMLAVIWERFVGGGGI